MFFKGSRYADVEEKTFVDAAGRELRYKRLRTIPRLRVRWRHTIGFGDRLDLIAHRFYRDPERYWRICDANFALWPEVLTETPGETISVPPSKG